MNVKDQPQTDRVGQLPSAGFGENAVWWWILWYKMESSKN